MKAENMVLSDCQGAVAGLVEYRVVHVLTWSVIEGTPIELTRALSMVAPTMFDQRPVQANEIRYAFTKKKNGVLN